MSTVIDAGLDFGIIKKAVDAQFKKMSQGNPELFTVTYDKQAVWETYLQAFPEGSNPIFKERTEHDCVCCKSFIRRVGGVVKINEDGSLDSIWDVNLEGPYGVVAKAMSNYVKSRPIENVFRNWERTAGQDKSVVLDETTSQTVTWRHFYCTTEDYFLKADKTPTYLGDKRSNFDVLKRSLAELTLESAEIVLELIEQNSLYRGEEHKRTVDTFIRLKNEYDAVVGDKDRYVWLKSVAMGGASKIRNQVIGSLLIDLSEGADLTSAVKSFEAKVAPSNYKRPTALITKGMIDKAQKTVVELGYESALQRRYAVTDDITINNVIYADRSVKPAMKGVFEELADTIQDKPKSLEKVEEISIEDFINNVVPKATGIEMLVENRHSGNLMSLVAPEDAEAKHMFKWDNNFSWGYNGEVADSMKEHVKAAGGNVTGDLRCSLMWYSRNDLDLHLIEPCGNLISFSSMVSRCGKGRLDVDNTSGGTLQKPAVENITWQKSKDIKEGRYKVLVHNYSGSNTNEAGFDFELEFKGTIYPMSYKQAVGGKKKVTCVEFDYTHADGVKIVKSLDVESASKEVWGITTESFNKVTMVMHSPNHWDGNKTGNKHWFFIMENCNSGSSARGFFNEFLKEELHEHRKVFEVLGSKLKVKESDNQLSGIGFSSTVSNHAYFRVSGAMKRTIKVRF